MLRLLPSFLQRVFSLRILPFLFNVLDDGRHILIAFLSY